MTHERIWIVLFICSVMTAFAIGSGLGYGTREFISRGRIEACSVSIADGTLKNCPPAINRAYQARAAQLAKEDVGVRDDALASVSQGTQERIVIYRERAADTAALNNVERTNQCAASPAMRLRREQLQRYAETGSSDEPDPSQPPG